MVWVIWFLTETSNARDNKGRKKMAGKDIEQSQPTSKLEMGTLVRVRTAAVEFDVSVNALYDAINNGKIKAVRLGKSVRIPRGELERIAAEGF
jgi:excisionase family DNA binding protein